MKKNDRVEIYDGKIEVKTEECSEVENCFMCKQIQDKYYCHGCGSVYNKYFEALQTNKLKVIR